MFLPDPHTHLLAEMPHASHPNNRTLATFGTFRGLLATSGMP